MILIAKISNGVKRKVQNHSVKQKMKYEIRNPKHETHPSHKATEGRQIQMTKIQNPKRFGHLVFIREVI